jgi:hypothetical protein
MKLLVPFLCLLQFTFILSCSSDRTDSAISEISKISISEWSEEILLHDSWIEYEELLNANSYAELNNSSGLIKFFIFLNSEIDPSLTPSRLTLTGSASDLNNFFNELIFNLDNTLTKQALNSTVKTYTAIDDSAGLIMGSKEVYSGFESSAADVFETFWSIASSPLETSERLWSYVSGLKKEDYEKFMAKMSDIVKNPEQSYENLKDFFIKYYDDKCQKMAVENGFELNSATFPQSGSIIESSVQQRLVGSAFFEVLLSFTGTKAVQWGLKGVKRARSVSLVRGRNTKKLSTSTASIADDVAKINAISAGLKPNAGSVISLSSRLGVKRLGTLFERVISKGLNGRRAANAYYNRIMHSLHKADKAGLNLSKTIDDQLLKVELHIPRPKKFHDPQIFKKDLIRDYLRARDEFGIFTDQNNISKLYYGRSATVRKGAAVGQQLEVDHLVPFNHAPELENVLSNLRYLPERANIIRSDTLDKVARDAVSQMMKVNPSWKPNDALITTQIAR